MGSLAALPETPGSVRVEELGDAGSCDLLYALWADLLAYGPWTDLSGTS